MWASHTALQRRNFNQEVIMQISVSGRHMSVGAPLSSHIEKSLSNAIHKYFGKEINAQVILEKDAPFFKAEILLHSNPLIKGESQGDNAYASFDTALKKIEQQLNKKHDKIKDHHHNQKDHLPYFGADSQEEVVEGSAMIIAESYEKFEKLSVAEAVKKLEKWNYPAYMFVNSSNNHVAMIYWRKDGNIGWVEYHESIRKK